MIEIHSMGAPAGNQNVISATCMYRHIAKLDDCNIGKLQMASGGTDSPLMASRMRE
jgi:hypothetical protein